MDYLADPIGVLSSHIQHCRMRWSETQNPWWLVRLAQLCLEIGDRVAATQVLNEGDRLFPTRKDFSNMLATIQRAAEKA